MGCGCGKHKQDAGETAVDGDVKQLAKSQEKAYSRQQEERTRPLDQCLFCAQKHADEALCCMNEFMYEQENRSFVHGSIRSVVNHTFKEWPAIAKVAREAALLWQEARFKEAQDRLKAASVLIDAELLKANPEIQARIDAAKEKPDAETESGK